MEAREGGVLGARAGVRCARRRPRDGRAGSLGRAEIEDELATLALETGDDDELADHGTRVRGGLFQA